MRDDGGVLLLAEPLVAILDVIAVMRTDRRTDAGDRGGRDRCGVAESHRSTLVASELTGRVADVGFFLAGCRFLNSW
jgi:hypothetical protein